MAGLVGVLQALGATRQRDGTFLLDCGALQLGSMFGGDLEGAAVATVAGEAVTFKSPPELAACGKVWMTDVADEDAFCQALGVALEELRDQTRGALATLRRLGFKARVAAPDPRARGSITREGHVIDVVVDAGGDLVVDRVDGAALPTSQQASLMAPEEAEPDEVNQLLEQVILSLAGGEATGIVPPALSEEELNELQAALSDDDDDDDDGDPDGFDDDGDDERTAAGVPMPPVARPAAADDDDDDVVDDVDLSEEGDEVDNGTVELRVQPPPGRQPPPPAEDFDDDDEPPTATLTTPIARAALQATIPQPRPPTRQVVADPTPPPPDDDDDDPFDGVGEPTATRPAGGRSTAVPPSMTPSRDDDEGGLLAAFEDDDEDEAADDAFDDRPTSVRGPDGSSVPAAPAEARRPGGGAFDDDDDVAPTSAIESNTGDDEHDGKTRALIIDADLLARLKRGDGDKPAPQQAVVPPQAPSLSSLPTAPARPMPQAPDDAAFDAPSTSATTNLQVPSTRGEHEPPSIASTRHAPDDDDSDVAGAFADAFEDSGLDVSVADDDADDDDGDDDGEEATGVVPVAAPARPPPRVADDDFDGDADGFDDGTQNAPIPSGGTGPGVELELMTLQARAVSLEAELQSVRARIETLLQQRQLEEATGSGTATARSAPPPQPQPAQPRVGDSDEGDAAETAGGGGFTSLPSLQSVDVHEVKASAVGASPRSNSLLDDFDEEEDESDDSAEDGDASGFDDGGPPDVRAPARAAAPAPADDDDEDVVSLAALQEELAQEGNATQVAASVMDFAPADDDGDVFGTGGGGESLVDEESLRSREAEMSEEATRIRTSRLSTIALVVEDERARDRLKKHLAERFSSLIEARDGQAVIRMKGIADVDAIVFIRPRHDDANVASLDRLEALPHRPRVLVISHDDAFDELAAVDLRLPLGQRASEVAQQVLDGLERLGIALAPAA